MTDETTGKSCFCQQPRGFFISQLKVLKHVKKFANFWTSSSITFPKEINAKA